MNLDDLMNTTPESLAEKQRDALEGHIIGRLQSAISRIKRRETPQLEAITFFSPAGDGDGSDNNCIDFSWTTRENIDIMQAYRRLCELDAIVKESEK